MKHTPNACKHEVFQNVKNARFVYKKWLSCVIVLIFVCGIACGCATTLPAPAPTAAPTEPAPDLVGFKAAIGDIISKKYDVFAYSNDDTRINIGVATNGLMQKVLDQKALGNSEPWVNAKADLLDFYGTVCETAASYGLKDMKIYLYLLNDTNTGKAILTILDGEIIGDYFAQ